MRQMTVAGKLAGWLAGSDLWQRTHKSLFLSASVFGNKGGERQPVSHSLLHIGSCFAMGESLFLLLMSWDGPEASVATMSYYSLCFGSCIKEFCLTLLAFILSETISALGSFRSDNLYPTAQPQVSSLFF